MGDGLQGFGNEGLGPYGLAVYQQRGRYVDLFPKQNKNVSEKKMRERND
jgi:hypothetical protein